MWLGECFQVCSRPTLAALEWVGAAQRMPTASGPPGLSGIPGPLSSTLSPVLSVTLETCLPFCFSLLVSRSQQPPLDCLPPRSLLFLTVPCGRFLHSWYEMVPCCRGSQSLPPPWGWTVLASPRVNTPSPRWVLGKWGGSPWSSQTAPLNVEPSPHERLEPRNSQPITPGAAPSTIGALPFRAAPTWSRASAT